MEVSETKEKKMKSVQINKIVSKFNRVNRSNKIKIICDTKKIQKNYFIYELKLTYTNKIDTISTFYIEKKSGIIEQPLPSNEYEKLFVNLINNQDNDDTLDLPFSYDHIEIKQIQKMHDEKKLTVLKSFLEHKNIEFIQDTLIKTGFQYHKQMQSILRVEFFNETIENKKEVFAYY